MINDDKDGVSLLRAGRESSVPRSQLEDAFDSKSRVSKRVRGLIVMSDIYLVIFASANRPR